MPLPKSVLEKYKNDVFVETGTLGGEAVRLAIDCGFKEIHSIDIDENLIATQRNAMEGNKDVHFYAGSSGVLLAGILGGLKGRVTFWLDAHPPGNELNTINTPVLAELDAVAAYVKTLPTELQPVVMLDDMRLFDPESKKAIWEKMTANWAGGLTYEDTHIASRDIMVYRPEHWHL